MIERVCTPLFIEQFDKACVIKRRVKWSDTQGLPLCHVSNLAGFLKHYNYECL